MFLKEIDFADFYFINWIGKPISRSGEFVKLRHPDHLRNPLEFKKTF